MLEVLKFVFSDLWTFLGTVVLILCVGESVSNIVVSLRRGVE